jgi:hypothetical protein
MPGQCFSKYHLHVHYFLAKYWLYLSEFDILSIHNRYKTIKLRLIIIKLFKVSFFLQKAELFIIIYFVLPEMDILMNKKLILIRK